MSLPFKLAVGLASSSSAVGLGAWKFINSGEESERPKIVKTSESQEIEEKALDEPQPEEEREEVSVAEEKASESVPPVPVETVKPEPVCSIVQIEGPSKVGAKVKIVKEIDSKNLASEAGKKTDQFNKDIKKACEPLGNGKKVYVTYSNGTWNYSGNYQTNGSTTDSIRKK